VLPNAPQTGACTIAHGVQSVGIDTNFNLEQAFELGQLSLYENIEDIPDISVSMQKFLDGYPLLYHLGASYDGTVGGATPLDPHQTTLSGRADTRADVRLVINATTNEAVTENNAAVTEMYCSGMYISSIGYTIPTDGTATEDVTFVGNNKQWIVNDADQGDQPLVLIDTSDNLVHAGFDMFGTDTPAAPGSHVQRKEDVLTDTSTASNILKTIQGYETVVPDIIAGVSTMSDTGFKGRNATAAGSIDTDNVHIQSFSCSTDLGREQINQLGTRSPYNRYVTFPTEVTCALEVIATAGDNVSATETARSNLSNHEICICLRDSTVLHLGKQNKLASVSYGGGDAGGGNASITYNFSNFNDLVVLHSGDPIRGSNTSTNTSTGYWGDRFD